jgi:hypothetical protein
MSPLEINLILHIYAIAEPFTHPNAPAYAKAKARFLNLDLIKQSECAACGYTLTPKGKAFVQILLSTPIPVEKTVFVDPRTNEVF